MKLLELRDIEDYDLRPKVGQRGSTPRGQTHQTVLQFEQPEGFDGTVGVTFDVVVDIQPHEYEDGYKSYNGGVTIENWSVQPFTWAGRQHNTIPVEMLEYYVDLAIDEEKLLDRALSGNAAAYNQLILGWLEADLDNQDYDVPDFKYRGIR